MQIGSVPKPGSSATKPFSLPPSAVTQTYGILAKRRGGKSYTAAVMAEEFAKAQVPFTVLDPTGAWWGLRASADGERAGLPVVVLGGAHGDAPLEPHMGKHVADLVVDHPGWYVLDTEAFESQAAQDRFVDAFATRLYLRKAKERSVMHLFIDEADEFVPQRPGKDQLHLLGAFENIVRRGGIRGLGTTLISQRAAVVNKNVLTQLDTLIVLQTTGPQDQDAVIDWVRRNATPEQLSEFKTTLASLPRGIAWVYSPEQGIFDRVAIRARRTFNSSKTPEAGETIVIPKRLAQVDLQAVMAAMAETIEKDKANDPVLLRKRIAELQRQIDNAPAAVPEKIVVEKTIPILDAENANRLFMAIPELSRISREVGDAAETIARLLADSGARVEERPSVQDPGMQYATVGRSGPKVVIPRPPDPTLSDFDNDVRSFGDVIPRRERQTVELKAGARRMLEVAARHHPVRLTRAQWATLSKMKVTGGTWGTYLSVLKRAGLIEESDGLVTVTEAGLTVAGVETGQSMSSEEVRDLWRSRLKAGARNMLDVLVDSYPEPVARTVLAEKIGMEVTGGTFGTYLSTLRRNGLADVEGTAVRATPTVMGL